jgi:hypothetical protein
MNSAGDDTIKLLHNGPHAVGPVGNPGPSRPGQFELDKKPVSVSLEDCDLLGLTTREEDRRRVR